jgi:hypothetical protein
LVNFKLIAIVQQEIGRRLFCVMHMHGWKLTT